MGDDPVTFVDVLGEGSRTATVPMGAGPSRSRLSPAFPAAHLAGVTAFAVALRTVASADELLPRHIATNAVGSALENELLERHAPRILLSESSASW